MSKKEIKENTKKVKRKKKKNPFRTFFSLILIFVACFFIYAAVGDFITTLRLRKEISSSEQMITDLEAQQEELEQEKAYLQDPEYVRRYARGKFLVSKPSEQIFKLPSKNADDSDD